MLGHIEDFTKDNLEDHPDDNLDGFVEDITEDQPDEHRSEIRNATCHSRLTVLADVHVELGSENSPQIPNQFSARARNGPIVDMDEITIESSSEIVTVGESSSMQPSAANFSITVPNKIVKIGRPKGAGLTVIGTQRSKIVVMVRLLMFLPNRRKGKSNIMVVIRMK